MQLLYVLSLLRMPIVVGATRLQWQNAARLCVNDHGRHGHFRCTVAVDGIDFADGDWDHDVDFDCAVGDADADAGAGASGGGGGCGGGGGGGGHIETLFLMCINVIRPVFMKTSFQIVMTLLSCLSQLLFFFIVSNETTLPIPKPHSSHKQNPGC